MSNDPDDGVPPALVEAGFGALSVGVNPAAKPDDLYHFTDVTGLVGMTQSKTIWASLATALNDQSEISYSIGLGRDLLRSGDLPGPASFWKHVEYYLEPDNSPADIQWRWQAFVCSFCDQAESALHWLHYGRAGKGVAICFRPTELIQTPFELVQILYEPGQQKNFLTGVLSSILHAFDQQRPGAAADANHPLIRTAAHIAAQAIWAAAPRIKSPVFSGEGEWRLMTHDIDGIDLADIAGVVNLPTKFRTSGTRLVPYKERIFSALPISKVIVGSCCETEPDSPALRHLLPGVECLRSRVPVRP